MVDKGF